MTLDQSKLKYDEQGLIPAIIQDVEAKDVLMMAYMNEEALKRTIESRQTWFWSRSRQEYWHKGATSGHFQDVAEISYDCDADCLLIKVRQTGAACHTGERSCFHNPLAGGMPDANGRPDAGGTDNPRETGNPPETEAAASAGILDEIYRVVMDRKQTMPEGSYTTYLFTKGLDKILKKVGEESAEVIIGAKNRSREELVYETGDLLYHLMVLLVNEGVNPQEVYAELAKRRK